MHTADVPAARAVMENMEEKEGLQRWDMKESQIPRDKSLPLQALGKTKNSPGSENGADRSYVCIEGRSELRDFLPYVLRKKLWSSAAQRWTVF